MSSTGYYRFGSGEPQDNLAFYLKGQASHIEVLQLALTINDPKAGTAKPMFVKNVWATYSALGLKPSPKIVAALKNSGDATARHEFIQKYYSGRRPERLPGNLYWKQTGSI